ncbi:sulfotransferase family protein [Actinocorallia populi]|uniref:sulfotransferase family protein n=1 Tax=Actinocorallia populi TaxID=2079200 RepID=UPI0018E5473F|nr:sulfotransferase [Actinocorallia populi]
MADDIRIDDLAAPRLTPAQQEALAYGESTPVDLSVDAVLETATARAGLDDFGSDDFRERLGLWLAEMEEDEDRTGLGRLSMFGECVRHAVNRLRIHDLLQRHPEIHDVPIERPVIVVGLPRSGTTHLVNMIAADGRFRSMPLWESREPVPDPRERPGPGGVDPRWERCDQSWNAARRTLPHLAAMHPLLPDHVHEELELELPDFSSYYIEWVARCPGWRDYYLTHDQTPHYAYMRTVLQILQWRRPGRRWVLKSPQHLEQLGPLLKTFPDATVVVTHRDPVSVVQSTATMMTYSARLHYRHTRPEWYVEYWTDRIRRLLDSAVRDRSLLPADRTVDVHFHEFMADEMGTVERIYDAAGLELTPEARSEIVAYHDSHRRGRDGQVVYDLRRDFGVTPDEVRAPFGFYLDRFDVRAEVR